MYKIDYDAKCKRCGKITKRHFANISGYNEVEFQDAYRSYIEDRMLYPRQDDCTKCKKPTIQEIVSYTTPKQ